MDDMIERVAWALAMSSVMREVRIGPVASAREFAEEVAEYIEWRRHLYLDDARAAIEAMREPTGAMQADGRDALEPYVSVLKREVTDQWQLARDTYRAMIDAALTLSEDGKIHQGAKT